MTSGSLLYVFARAPEEGRVKTRLVPAVGARGAARLHAAFVDDVCALSRGVASRRVLSIAGDAAHPQLVALARREGMERVAQGDGDLGARMSAAIDAGLGAGASAVAIIGSDSPVLPASFVARALAALGDAADVVVGPAEDGGYWLVGARRSVPWLFANLAQAWGGPSVLAETERRLLERGATWARAERFWDVDEPADLERLRAALAADPTLAPASRAALTALAAEGRSTPAP